MVSTVRWGAESQGGAGATWVRGDQGALGDNGLAPHDIGASPLQLVASWSNVEKLPRHLERSAMCTVKGTGRSVGMVGIGWCRADPTGSGVVPPAPRAPHPLPAGGPWAPGVAGPPPARQVCTSLRLRLRQVCTSPKIAEYC